MMGLDRDRLIELVQVVVRNPLRAFLSALGVGWGLFMIIITVGAARGLENGVKADMGNDVANSMFAWTMSTSIPYKGYQRGRYVELDIDDVAWLQANTQHLDLVCPEVQLGGYRGTNNVTRGKQSGAFDVHGAIAEYQQVKPMNITEGRFLNQGDLDGERKVCVIGSRVQEILFDFEEEPIGETVQIQGVIFRVVGVYTPKGNDEDAQNEAESIYIPFSTFSKSFNTRGRVGWLSMLIKDGVDAEEAEEATKQLIKSRLSIHPDDPRAIGCWSMAEEFQKAELLFSGMRLISLLFGSLALLAGVIGITNIMLISIKERTKELGIRRSLGATPIRILRQIIGETLFLTLLAGLCGLVLGVGLLEAVDG
ncbi:MAG: ABC transporter permease, partial [Flavobacteriales bacterium]